MLGKILQQSLIARFILTMYCLPLAFLLSTTLHLQEHCLQRKIMIPTALLMVKVPVRCHNCLIYLMTLHMIRAFCIIVDRIPLSFITLIILMQFKSSMTASCYECGTCLIMNMKIRNEIVIHVQ